MKNKENERLLYEISNLETIVKKLKFDFSLLNDEEFENITAVLEKKVKIALARIKAKELLIKLKEKYIE
jgi:hypothetical protein